MIIIIVMIVIIVIIVIIIIIIIMIPINSCSIQIQTGFNDMHQRSRSPPQQRRSRCSHCLSMLRALVALLRGSSVRAADE